MQWQAKREHIMSRFQKSLAWARKPAITFLLLAGLHAASTAQAKLPRPDHIVIVIEENKGFQQVMDTEDAVYLQSLIKQGASLTNMHAFHHPSQANYYELFSGNSQGIKGDGCPKERFTASSLGGLLNAKSDGDKKLSFAGYAEDLPLEDFKSATFKEFCENHKKCFALKHTPWLGFEDSYASTRDFSAFVPSDDLPTVAVVVPNLQNDMHDGSIQCGSEWLEKHIKPYVDWVEKHNSLLIVTWDEDNHKSLHPITTKPPQNQIPTIFVGPMVKPCSQSDKQYTHYDLLRTIEDIYSLAHLGATESAKDIDDVWKNGPSEVVQPCIAEVAKQPAKSQPQKPAENAQRSHCKPCDK